jgi:hypothetical protein
MGGIVISLINQGLSANTAQQGATGLYRPALWSSVPQKYSLTVTLPQSGSSSTPPSNASGGTAGTPTTFFFDAVLRADYDEEVMLTKHPVQNGASITDHSIALPPIIVLEAAFADTMDSYTPGQYSGQPTKTQSVYATFQNIKNLRLPCTLATRFSQYQTVVLTQMRASDSNVMNTKLVLYLRFEQVLLGTVTQTQSARPNATNSSPEGSISPLPVPGTTYQQASVPGAPNQPQYNSNTLPSF